MNKPTEANLQRAREFATAQITWSATIPFGAVVRRIALALDEAEQRGRESVCAETATATALQIAIEREREACARMVQEYGIELDDPGVISSNEWEARYGRDVTLAAAIRARGKT